LLGIALNRSGSDFNEADRTALDLLQGHLVQAYQQAELMTELKKDAARTERVLQALDRVWLVLAADGRVLQTSEAAARLLRLYCPQDRCAADSLPEAVWAWARSQIILLCPRVASDAAKCQATSPLARSARLALSRPGGELFARLVPDDQPNQFLLILEERTREHALAALQSLGLTTREAEVLWQLMQGDSNPMIGRHLSVSPRTVQKHVERIFAKLGVTTRSAAAVKAMQCLTA
jgi:DNA-binding NarL/FixJ family response regulator